MKIILLFLITLSLSSWGQSMNTMTHKEKIQYTFEKLSKDSLHVVDEFYDTNVEFHDPVGMIKGSDK